MVFFSKRRGGSIINTKKSIELWERRFSDRKLSGQKVNDWCEKNHVSRHAYYYWHRIIKNVKQKVGNKEQLVEIPIPLSSPVPISKENKENDVVITWNDFTITIRKSSVIPIAAELMKKLVAAC